MSMSNTEKTVKDIRRKTRRKFSTEEKIRICTSSANLGPMGLIFKRHFSASCFSSLTC